MAKKKPATKPKKNTIIAIAVFIVALLAVGGFIYFKSNQTLYTIYFRENAVLYTISARYSYINVSERAEVICNSTDCRPWERPDFQVKYTPEYQALFDKFFKGKDRKKMNIYADSEHNDPEVTEEDIFTLKIITDRKLHE